MHENINNSYTLLGSSRSWKKTLIIPSSINQKVYITAAVLASQAEAIVRTVHSRTNMATSY